MNIDTNKLKAFYGDKAMMESVYGFFLAHLDKMALQRVMERKDTAAIPDAKEVIDNAILELDALFGIKKEKKPKSSR